MDINTKANVIMVVILLVVLSVFVGCARKPSTATLGTEVITSSGILPAGARLITDYGAGWIKFELDGEVFLFHKATVGTYQGFESLAHIR